MPLKWGPFSIDDQRRAREHFLFLGSTGSGKTVLLQMLMRSALTRGVRSLVYDSKNDFYPILRSSQFNGQKVLLLNPFDRRGMAWDISKDASSDEAARQVASNLIQYSDKSGERASDSERFFAEAAREVVAATIVGLNRRSEDIPWDLRDLLMIVHYPERLDRFLASTDTAIGLRTKHLYLNGSERTRQNILSSVGTALGALDVVASAWHHAATENGRLAIKDWAKSGDTLVLGNYERARASIDPIYRGIFQRITEELLGEQRYDASVAESLVSMTSQTWLFLDEVREAGPLQGLRRLMNKGRSSGICVVLGIQDVAGMRSAYGADEATEILSCCKHIAILNVVHPETAQWAVSLFGNSYEERKSESTTFGMQYSQSEQRKDELRTLFTTRDFLEMPTIAPETGMSGYYRSPLLIESSALADVPIRKRFAPWKSGNQALYSWSQAIQPYLPTPNPTVQGLMVRNSSDFSLQQWSSDEESFFLYSVAERAMAALQAEGPGSRGYLSPDDESVFENQKDRADAPVKRKNPLEGIGF